MNPLRGACLAALLAALAACQSTLYVWGPYEESVLSVVNEFSDSDLLHEIDALENHIADLAERDRHPAPGVHAHVGYLQYLAGNGDAAVRHFEAEKAIYPESRVFVDGMLERMR